MLSLLYDDGEHKYDWCFICRDGVFAIRWCGTTDVNHTAGFVLYHKDGRLQLTDHGAGYIPPEHFLHNFYTDIVTDHFILPNAIFNLISVKFCLCICSHETKNIDIQYKHLWYKASIMSMTIVPYAR